MACRSDAESALRQAGRRVTNARIAVIEALRHSGRHMTPREVAETVRADLPHVDTSTVYRTLEDLSGAHIVSETILGHGESYYEWIGGAPHHHLRCDSCDAVTTLDLVIVKNLVKQTSARHEFRLNAAHLILEGRCASCLAAEPLRTEHGR